jgi:hypothetical protein
VATVNDRSAATRYRGNSALGVAGMRHFAKIGKTFVHSIWLISAERQKLDGGKRKSA